MFAESLRYHPMGLVILLLLIFIAVQSVLPARCRDRLNSYLQTRAVIFNLLYLAFVGLFVIYGAGRALVHYAE